MTSLTDIQDFLSQKRLAIVGVSSNPKDFSRQLLREFQTRGYEVAPVHPSAPEMEGRPCYPNLAAIQPPVDRALLMTSPAVSEQVVRECAQTGIRKVWLYRATGTGAVSPAAVDFCRQQSMMIIPGECPLMFLPGTAWFHHLHGLVKKITGSYPKS